MKRTRISPVSKRRRIRDRGYAEARKAVWERERGACQLCGQSGTDVHHLAGRGGPDPHHLSNLALLCRRCHDRVHAQPAWARRVGFMVSRLADAEGEALPPGAA